MTLALWETGFRTPRWILEPKDKKVVQGREKPWSPVCSGSHIFILVTHFTPLLVLLRLFPSFLTMETIVLP